MIRSLHLASRFEAISWLFLIAATLVKYLYSYELGVSVIGPIHGVLYLVYIAAIARWFRELNWNVQKAILAAILGVLPLGGFIVDKWVTSSEQ
jgi:integral membrane protein